MIDYLDLQLNRINIIVNHILLERNQQMFSYFKNKQQQQKSTQPKVSASFVPIENSRQPITNKTDSYLTNSIKLSSNIFAQLLNQSTTADKLVDDQGSNGLGEKPRKQLLQNYSSQRESNEVRDQQDRQRQLIDENPKSEVQKQPKQEQSHQQENNPQKSLQLNSLIHSPLQQQSIISPKLTLPIQSNNLSSLSQSELTQLFQMFTNVFTSTIQSQLLGEKLDKQQKIKNHYNLLPTTLQTIKKLNSTFYQQFILQTKEKYNHLVDQSTNLYLKSRQIANLFNQFVMSINLFFQSQQLAIPAQQIQKAIAQLNPQKTQKYMNYLIKIFQANFDDVIEKRVKQMKLGLQNQIRKSQKQIKQLDQELKRVSSVLKQKQSTFTDQESKFSEKQLMITSLKRQINELNIKLNNVSSSSKSTQQDYNSQLSLLKRQLQRAKKQSQQLAQKNKKQLKLLEKKENLLKEKQQEIQKLGHVIKKVKEVQSQGMENIVEEMEMKEKMFADKIEKFSAQKIQLQQKIRTLMAEKESNERNISQLMKENSQQKEEINKIKEELISVKEELDDIKEKKESRQQNREGSQQLQQGKGADKKITKKKNNKSIPSEQQDSQDQSPQTPPSNLINKQIFKHLFLSFDDESKQWAVRNNIRHQIYIMLDIKKGSNSGNGQNVVGQQQQKVLINSRINDEGNNGVSMTNKKQEKKMAQGSLIGKWLGW